MPNREKFVYCRIPAWHQVGYTGKGIKVAVFEDITQGHGRMVADVLQQILPDAAILNRQRPGPIETSGDRLTSDTKARIEAFYRSLVAEGVHMCVMSLGGTGAAEIEQLEREELIDKGVVLFTSAGNEGRPISPGSSASLETWISVGACTLVNGKPRLTDYSNTGPELDVVGFTNLYTTWGGVFTGTSCANPFVAGLCALWSQWHRERYGRTPNQAEMLEFIKANSEDLGEPGRDDMHGFGLLRLPDPATLTKEETPMPSRRKVYVSPSTQEANQYAGGLGTEEQHMQAIGAKVEQHLVRCGFEVRRNRPEMTLAQVVQDSNAWGPDAHVAIHSNAGGGQGTECWYYAGSTNGRALAEAVYAEVAQLTPASDRGIKATTGLYELAKTITPACILEVAFHDRPEEAAWIVEHREQVAEAIAKGICKYFSVAWVSEPTPAPAEPPASQKTILKLKVGGRQITRNDGKVFKLDVPARVEDGRTLVPLRALCEALGAQVHYDPKTGEITITM